MEEQRINAGVQPPDRIPDTAFDTRSQAHAALLALVADQGTSLSCFSTDFSGWPLQQSAFIRQLELWALRDTRRTAALRMLAVDWSTVRQRFPRFTAFRRDFAHLLDCRQIAESHVRELHEMAWAPQCAVYAHTATWMTGEQLRNPRRLHAQQLQYEAAWQQAAPAFPVTTLGL